MTIFDGGWFKISFVSYLNQGLGLIYIPNTNQIGLIFIFWAIVITWDDSEESDDEYDPDYCYET